MADQPNVLSADEAYDAFGRLRISQPITLFSSQLQYDLEPLQYEAFISDAGQAPVFDANKRMAVLEIEAAELGGTVGMQSYSYVPYQAGKSHAIFMTAVLSTPVAGVTKRIGYFDDSNGVFFEMDGDGIIYTVLRSKTSGSVVDRKVPQSDWNDPHLPGTRAPTFEFSRAQIFVFDLQFLGMGRVRFGLDVNGEIFYVHEYLNANALSEPYMQTGSLPLRIEMVAASAIAESAFCYLKCCAVNSEGGSLEDFNYPFSAAGTATAGNNAPVHILSVRPNTTFNSIENRIMFVLDNLDLTVTGNQIVQWQLCIGSTFAGGGDPTWADVDATNSGFEAGTGGTVSSIGTVITQGFVAASAQSKSSVTRQTSNRYPIAIDKAGAVRANGTLSLFVTGLGGVSATRAVMNWKEIR